MAELGGADIEQVRRGIGSDPRIGKSFLFPGVGYGGSCFPKDVKALVRTGEKLGYDLRILKAVEDVNERQKSRLFEKVDRYFSGDLKGKTFAVWGLAFKPNTDDMREASSRTLMEHLWAQGAKVRAFDPVAMEETRRIYGDREDLTLVSSPDEALLGASGLIIVTEWNVFRSPDFEKIRSTLAKPVIFDGRNLYDPLLLKGLGIDYYGIGRGQSIQRSTSAH